MRNRKSKRHLSFIERFSPVDRLLAECLRVNIPVEGDIEAVREACRAVTDWSTLGNRAEMHGVVGWAHEVLLHLGGRYVPPEAVEQLKQARLKSAAIMASKTSGAAEVITAFSKAGVSPIILKGPFLSEHVYPRPDIRYFGDIDLLVRECDFERVGEVFSEIGYRRVEDDPARIFDEGKTQVHYYKKGCLPVDLHYQIINLPTHKSAFSINTDEVWDLSRETNVVGVKALALSPEDLLIFQCVHMTAHHNYNRLLWFKDVEQVVRRFAQYIDWREFVNRVEHYRLKTFVYYSLLMTGDICGDLSIPDWVIESLRPKYATARVFERLVQRTDILELRGKTRVPALEVWRIMRDERQMRYAAILRRTFPKVEWYLECYPFLPKIRHQRLYYGIYPVLVVMRMMKRPANLMLSGTNKPSNIQ